MYYALRLVLALSTTLQAPVGPRLVVTHDGNGPPNVVATGWVAVLIIFTFFASIIAVAVRFILLRRRAHALAVASATQFQSLFEHNPCSLLVYDVHTLDVIQVNQSAINLFGYSKEELLQHMAVLLSPEDLAPFVREQAALIDLTAHSHMVTRMRRKDGVILDVDVRGHPTSAGGRTARLVMILDITQRLAAERGIRVAAEEAHAARHMLQSLINVAPHAILATDEQLRVTVWNEAATALFGWTEAEIMGRPLPYVPADQMPDFLLRVQSTRDDAVHGSEVTRQRKDGTLIDVFVASAVLLNDEKLPVGYIGVFTDLSERKLLEQQLRQSQKMEAVGRLAGGIAHDFNNILTVISSYSSMLLADHPDDIDTDPLQEINTAVRRAAALTRQLLSFSRKQVVQLAPIDLNTVVTHIEPMLRRIVPENIRFSATLPALLGCVMADSGQIEQVIMNLVVNASDAMPDGGSLSLETGNVELDDEYVRAHADVVAGSYVMLAATDTGIGMNAETLSHIFEPFFTTKPEGQGTGIGLATTYAIVRQFGGHIWVYSEPGSGTTFKLYFPRQDVPPVDLEALKRKSGPRVRQGVVLLVEDDATVRRSVSSMLTRHGYEVIEAVDAENGLALVAQHQETISTVLTDLMMPGMNGRDFSAAIRVAHPRMRIVLTSGYTDDEVLRRGLLENGRLFLQKPFSAEQLLGAIDGS
ncbi:MAG: sensor protein [Gemmatimonadetes bacterium]|nr:sensor protein [Gemmatimonadota bacterium]